MKKSLLRYAATMMAAMSLIGFVGCSSSDDVENPDDKKPVVEKPNFPALVEGYITSGGEYTLTIEPNMDWKVSVPTATANLFWIQDGEHVRYSKEGKAGKHEVVIACADVEDFASDAVCEVSMTMDSKTELIARIIRKKNEYSISFYAAEIDTENNDFVRTEEYEIVYGAELVTSTSMIWPLATVGYMQWIKVVANFEWTIGGEIPAWLQVPVTSGEPGTEGVTFRMDSNPTHYPDRDTSCTLLFQDQSGDEPVTVAELEVTIPGVKDYLSLELASQLTFNMDGHYLSDGTANELGAHGTLTSTKGANLYVLSYFERDGVTYLTGDSSMTDWVELTIEEWDDSEGDAGLRSRRVNILCKPNESDSDRKALILALPASEAAAIKNADQLVDNFTQVKEQYAEYVCSEVTQHLYTPEEEEKINPHLFSVEEANKQNAWFELVTSGDTYEKYKEYGVPVYELTFVGQCNRNMVMIVDANYDYYISAEDKAWLDFDRSDYSTVVMSVSEMPQIPITGAIFFYPEGTTEEYLFIIACTYKAE